MRKNLNLKVFFILLIINAVQVTLYSQNNEIHHNPWELILYRPENAGDMNDVRCYLKVEDAETGDDVTYSKIKATYEWVSIPDVANPYQNIYYLDGGMAMHMNIQPGKYKIQVYTPFEKQNGVQCTSSSMATWESNIFEYDTENPTKVIFVYPTANDNGFYDGGWYIDYKAPKWFKFTKPKQKY
ncbi:MAG: hypothetical protein K6G00_01750 [Treponema sp.]|nr:hypothetical protein [Treponema sp.]